MSGGFSSGFGIGYSGGAFAPLPGPPPPPISLLSITPTQSDAQAALAAFLGNLFSGAVIIAAQANRVPEPHSPTFILMSALSFERQATNWDGDQDVKLIGSITGTALTVTNVDIGSVVAGMPLFGPGVAAGTRIVAQQAGIPGNVGLYSVSLSQDVAFQVMSGGTKTVITTYIMTVQLDFHSPDYTAGNWAQTFSNMFRDEYAVAFFEALPAPRNTISPLYSDDAAQRPFLNAEQQYEWRWVVDAKMQVDQTVVVPQTYDDSVIITLFEANLLQEFLLGADGAQLLGTDGAELLGYTGPIQ